ncbi:hypothetical protein bcgnr5384_48420 [Bacillus cereus]
MSKGFSIFLFTLDTGLFWFSKQTTVNPKVETFFEMDYLFGKWNFIKITLSPVSVKMFALAYAF